MNIPHTELLAPVAMLKTVGDVDRETAVLALDGRAGDLSCLSEFKNLRVLWLSRVSKGAADAAGQVPAIERLVVHDYKLPDLTPFSQLTTLESLAIAGSPKLKSLAGLEHLVQLRELILFDNCNYSDLRAVEHLLNLETLCLAGGFSKHLEVHSLGPLSALRPLRRLRLASIRAVEDGLRPLATLANLREVFIAATFGSTELQFLAQALPDAKGEFLDSYR